MTQEDESGWSSGVRELNGEQGLFPASYVTPAPEENLRKPPPRPVSKPAAVVVPAVTTAQEPEEEEEAPSPASSMFTLCKISMSDMSIDPMLEEMARRMKKMQTSEAEPRMCYSTNIDR